MLHIYIMDPDGVHINVYIRGETGLDSLFQTINTHYIAVICEFLYEPFINLPSRERNLFHERKKKTATQFMINVIEF